MGEAVLFQHKLAAFAMQLFVTSLVQTRAPCCCASSLPVKTGSVVALLNDAFLMAILWRLWILVHFLDVAVPTVASWGRRLNVDFFCHGPVLTCDNEDEMRGV